MRSTCHNFRRGCTTAASAPNPIVGAAGFVPYTNWYGAALSEVLNSSEFTTLYDQYRLNYVVLKFWLKIDPSAQAAASASYPKIFYYRDYDDSTVPGNLNEIRENQRCRVVVMNPNRPVVIKFRPNMLQLMYNDAISSTFKPAWKQWVDCSLSSARHFGIKFAIDDLTNTNYRVDIEKWIYFSCRNTR